MKTDYISFDNYPLHFYVILGSFFLISIGLSSCDDKEPVTKPDYSLTTTALPLEGGEITPSSGIFQEGESVIITAEPNDKWVFQKWEGDLSGNSNPITLKMTSNKSIVGVFEFLPPTFVKNYGGNNSETGYSIIQTHDGGFVLTGTTLSNDGDFNGLSKGFIDIFVLKVNSLGEKQWMKTFGGSEWDWGYSILQIQDGGYILSGYTRSNDGDFSGLNRGDNDVFVIKLNSSGEKEWVKIFGGSATDSEAVINKTIDDGFVLTGTTLSNDGDFSGLNRGNDDVFVIKLNSSGEKQWVKVFGGSDGESGTSIVQTQDGGYILTGSTNSNDGDFEGLNIHGDDIFVIKLDNLGQKQWIKTFGGNGRTDTPWTVIQVQDGGYLIAGFSDSNDGDFNGLNKGEYDAFVIKLNSLGEKQWIKTYGGNKNDHCRSVTQTQDGGYVLTGFTESNDKDFNGLNKGDYDIFVIKLFSSGDKQWIKTIGGNNLEWAYSIIQSQDGGYIFTGTVASNNGDFSHSNGAQDIFIIRLE